MNDSEVTIRALNAMLEYFEIGNKETDAAAKNILELDFENDTYWADKISSILKSGEWTGIRVIEADILATALRAALERMEETD